MTRVYLTIDTEYSVGLYRTLGRSGREEIFARSISGRTVDGEVGIFYQLDRLDRHGHKGVFFVDPMPALIWGTEAIADVVQPIIARGHDVQLHLHAEWLEHAGAASPVGPRTGRNMRDFGFEDQARLIDYGIRVLMEAGAPRPVAFRAGNYGANDDTLRALAALGVAYDTSHCPGFAGSDCEIGLDGTHLLPVARHGVVEVPIGAIRAFGAVRRHAQITAVSTAELIAALRFLAATEVPAFTLVSHSFELLSRDRSRINRVVKRRFDRFCKRLALMPECRTATYASDPPPLGASLAEPPISGLALTSLRVAEQFVSNRLYGSA